jgi:hypothetical protein
MSTTSFVHMLRLRWSSLGIETQQQAEKWCINCKSRVDQMLNGSMMDGVVLCLEGYTHLDSIRSQAEQIGCRSSHCVSRTKSATSTMQDSTVGSIAP